MTVVVVLMWIYVIGVLVAALVMGAAFRYANSNESEMDAKRREGWDQIKVQAEMRNLSLDGFAVLLAFFWPWFLLKRS